MDERALLILGVVGLVGFIVGLGVWAQGQRKKMAAAWTDLAQAHGLVHKEGVNHVMGEIEMGRKIFMFQDVARDAFGQELSERAATGCIRSSRRAQHKGAANADRAKARPVDGEV